MSIRLLVVDDQDLVRTGFRLFLATQDDLEVVGEAGDGRQAIELARELRPDVVLMDIRMPRMDGVRATAELTAAGIEPPPRVPVLTTFDLDEYVFGALRAGAAGFLLRDAPRERLVEAIRVVHAGDAPREVLVLVAGGLSNREIAQRLVISAAAVKSHVGSLLLKLGLRDRVQAVVFAYEHGIIVPGR